MNKTHNQFLEEEFVLTGHNLSKTFTDSSERDFPVLKNININIKPADRVAIIGSSGVGKSTLLQILGGLDSPTSGEVRVSGVSIHSLTEKAKNQLRNKYLGFVYQFHHLLPEFNALENVCMPLLIGGMSAKRARKKAESYIERVGLKHRKNHRVGELSGGERQRIAIARAVVTEPKCVLADEPTGNLDEETASKIEAIILQLNQDCCTSLVIVTHNKNLAKKMHRILVLQQGTLTLKE